MTVAVGSAQPFRAGLQGCLRQAPHAKGTWPSDSLQVGGKERNKCSKEANCSLIEKSPSEVLIHIYKLTILDKNKEYNERDILDPNVDCSLQPEHINFIPGVSFEVE